MKLLRNNCWRLTYLCTLFTGCLIHYSLDQQKILKHTHACTQSPSTTMGHTCIFCDTQTCLSHSLWCSERPVHHHAVWYCVASSFFMVEILVRVQSRPANYFEHTTCIRVCYCRMSEVRLHRTLPCLTSLFTSTSVILSIYSAILFTNEVLVFRFLLFCECMQCTRGVFLTSGGNMLQLNDSAPKVKKKMKCNFVQSGYFR